MDWTDAGLVVILLALMQVLKLIPWLQERTGIVPLLAVVLGIVLDGLRALCWEKVPLDLTVFPHGALIGAAAIAAYNVGMKSLAPLVSKSPPAMLLLFLLPLLAVGCAEARHEYTLEACNQVLSNADSMQVLALDYSTGAGAKALQDLKRLDDALMLKIEQIAKATYTDDKARQAAILEAMITYKTDVAAIETDRDHVRDRDARFKEFVDATKEAAAGLLMVEARSWANKAAMADLIDKAVVGKLFQLAPVPAKAGGK